jgi:hypothetical protein
VNPAMLRLTARSAALRLAAYIAAGAIGLAGSAQAQVIVSDTVTQSGGLYHYDYTVTNDSASDLLFLDIAAPPDPTAVQNPMAPAGYDISFDSGLGLVSLLEDTDPFFNPQFFGPTPVSGFTYDSPFAPMDTTFTAYTEDVNNNLVVLASGSVVPEPGAASAYLICGATGALLLRRRQRVHFKQSISPSQFNK